MSFIEEKFERRLTEETKGLETTIESVKAELEVKIENIKIELIKWMFLFWAGQIAVITGILFAFLRK